MLDSKTHRKRLKRFEIVNQPRFLTFSCYKRLPLLNNDRIKALFLTHLQRARESSNFRLYAWVLMPEHVHLIMVPDLPQHPLRKVLTAVKRSFAEEVIRRWKTLKAWHHNH